MSSPQKNDNNHKEQNKKTYYLTEKMVEMIEEALPTPLASYKKVGLQQQPHGGLATLSKDELWKIHQMLHFRSNPMKPLSGNHKKYLKGALVAIVYRQIVDFMPRYGHHCMNRDAPNSNVATHRTTDGTTTTNITTNAITNASCRRPTSNVATAASKDKSKTVSSARKRYLPPTAPSSSFSGNIANTSSSTNTCPPNKSSRNMNRGMTSPHYRPPPVGETGNKNTSSHQHLQQQALLQNHQVNGQPTGQWHQPSATSSTFMPSHQNGYFAPSQLFQNQHQHQNQHLRQQMQIFQQRQHLLQQQQRFFQHQRSEQAGNAFGNSSASLISSSISHNNNNNNNNNQSSNSNAQNDVSGVFSDDDAIVHIVRQSGFSNNAEIRRAIQSVREANRKREQPQQEEQDSNENDNDNSNNGISNATDVANRGTATIDEVICAIVKDREDRQLARDMDHARRLSEMEHEEETKRLKMQREEDKQNQLLSATLSDLLHPPRGDLQKLFFPKSWLLRHEPLQDLVKGLIDSTDHLKAKGELLKLLKLEKDAGRWYSNDIPKAYFTYALATRLLDVSIEQTAVELQKICQEVQEGHSLLSQQNKDNLPFVYVTAQEKFKTSLAKESTLKEMEQSKNKEKKQDESDDDDDDIIILDDDEVRKLASKTKEAKTELRSEVILDSS